MGVSATVEAAQVLSAQKSGGRKIGQAEATAVNTRVLARRAKKCPTSPNQEVQQLLQVTDMDALPGLSKGSSGTGCFG